MEQKPFGGWAWPPGIWRVKSHQERIKPGEWIYPYIGTDDV